MTRRNRDGSPTRAGNNDRSHDNQRFPICRLTHLIVFLAVVAVSTPVTFRNVASQEPSLCPDIHYLIEQSRSRFATLRGDVAGDSGGYNATFVLPGAWSCTILDDAEKSSYRCVWKYSLGEEQAHQAFQRLLKEMRSCIGNMAGETTDQSVNHPDFYASYYYRLPDSAASVNLKNKAKLGSTLVSIRIDGFTKSK